jgi:hypothetical protein
MPEARGHCPDCGFATSRPGGYCRSCSRKRVNRTLWTPERRAAVRAKWTPERRAERSKQQRAVARRDPLAWARRCHPGDYWTVPEDSLLRRLAGTVTLRELAERVSALGIPRTAHAVEQRARRIGVDTLCAPGITINRLRDLFGVGRPNVLAWIENGLLRGRRISDAPRSHWVVDDQDLRTFIRNHPEAYDWRRITVRRWRAEAEVASRAAPFSRGGHLVTTSEAAKLLGITRHVFARRYIVTGALPAFPLGGGTQRRGPLHFRRADVLALSSDSSERRGVA